MNDDLIRARLNLFAVLQNLEDLVKLDAQTREMARDWDISIQFTVLNGPAAWLAFKDGACTHGRGRCGSPDIKLFFTSPRHLNRMFDGQATPIPLKGFTRLGFLKNEFTKLTERLTHFLKPEDAVLQDPDYIEINTALLLYTAVYAVRELAALEPTCMKVASRIPGGTLRLEVLPEGPAASMTFGDGEIGIEKNGSTPPMARMAFRDMQAANDVLGGRLDGFQAVACGAVALEGQLPIIDNVNLILDRVESYLE
jgi:hypothetical protein